jgi:methyl halide transferase
MGTTGQLGGKLLIGLTGNIACGKSTALARLAQLGAGVIDADEVTRALQRRGAPAYAAMVAALGPGILQADGEIDRKALGNRVFARPDELRRLEGLVRPLVRDEILRRLPAMPEPVVVIDAIGLLEGPLVDLCRQVWVVTCAPEQQVARLVATRGLTEDEAWLRVRAQGPQAEKVARADVVLDNSGARAALVAQVDRAWAAVPMAAPPLNRGRYAGTDAPDHWEALYQRDDTGWDLGGPAPAFFDLLDGPDAPPPGRLIAPGSGRGHDALLFAARGFDVVGVDFAPSAVAQATAAAAERGLADRARFIERDIFALPPEYRGAFDYALEHTCLSALDPRLAPEYAALITRLLRPGGVYLALFFTHGRPGGPPYTTSEAAVRELFAGRLRIERLGPPGRSAPARSGAELFAVMRKAPA